MKTFLYTDKFNLIWKKKYVRLVCIWIISVFFTQICGPVARRIRTGGVHVYISVTKLNIYLKFFVNFLVPSVKR
jgi:hypothetical protein